MLLAVARVLCNVGLLCTAFLVLIVLQTVGGLAFNHEWSVENRTDEPLWVMPLNKHHGRFGLQQEQVGYLAHYPTGFSVALLSDRGEILVEPQSGREFMIDFWQHSDNPAVGMLVRSAR